GDHLLCQVTNRELIRISAVHRSGNLVGGIHQTDDSADQIIDKAKRTRLLSVSVDCYVLVIEGLNDKIRHDTTVIRLHARSVSIENSQYLDFQIVLPPIVEKQRFGATLAFII